MKKDISPDKEKAKALWKMSLMSLDRLTEISIEKYPSNSLSDYYDIIHKLLEALTLIEGVKMKGEGAHYTLINYAKDRWISIEEEIFLQQMREFRNRVQYEGFLVTEEYIRRNSKTIKEIIHKLNKKIEEHI